MACSKTCFQWCWPSVEPTPKTSNPADKRTYVVPGAQAKGFSCNYNDEKATVHFVLTSIMKVLGYHVPLLEFK